MLICKCNCVCTSLGFEIGWFACACAAVIFSLDLEKGDNWTVANVSYSRCTHVDRFIVLVYLKMNMWMCASMCGVHSLNKLEENSNSIFHHLSIGSGDRRVFFNFSSAVLMSKIGGLMICLIYCFFPFSTLSFFYCISFLSSVNMKCYPLYAHCSQAH